MTSSIALTDATLRYGEGENMVTILDRFSFRVEPGEIVAILGASGSGKSSLLKILCGLEELTSGSARILGGHPLHALREGRSAIASSDAALLPWRSAIANIRLPLDLLGRDQGRSNQRALALLRDVLIEDLASRRASALSEGQCQRVRLAQALATDPDLLLLDEPFSSADEGLRDVLTDVVLKYVRASPRRSAVLVTHYSLEAATLADRIIIVSGLPLCEIYKESQTPDPLRRKPEQIMSITAEIRPHLIRSTVSYKTVAPLTCRPA